MNSYTFTDTDPEVIDEIVEQIKAEEETEVNTESIVEEETTTVEETTVAETVEEETTETEVEVEEQEQDSFFATLLENPLIIFGMVVCLVIGGIAVIVLIKSRRK